MGISHLICQCSHATPQSVPSLSRQFESDGSKGSGHSLRTYHGVRVPGRRTAGDCPERPLEQRRSTGGNRTSVLKLWWARSRLNSSLLHCDPASLAGGDLRGRAAALSIRAGESLREIKLPPESNTKGILRWRDTGKHVDSKRAAQNGNFHIRFRTSRSVAKFAPDSRRHRRLRAKASRLCFAFDSYYDRHRRCTYATTATIWWGVLLEHRRGDAPSVSTARSATDPALILKPVLALISDCPLDHKSNGCSKFVPVIHLFIRPEITSYNGN
jgi:hypothetical protein